MNSRTSEIAYNCLQSLNGHTHAQFRLMYKNVTSRKPVMFTYINNFSIYVAFVSTTY